MECDLGKVYEALAEIKHKWYSLGLQLGVKTSTLDGIRSQFQHDHGMALIEVIREWLKQTVKPCSWEALVEALRTNSVNEEKTAKTIEMKYVSGGGMLALINKIYTVATSCTCKFSLMHAAF